MTTNEELEAAICRVREMADDLDGPDADRSERLDRDALWMLADAAEVLIGIRKSANY